MRKCSRPNCKRDYYAKELCNRHYNKKYVLENTLEKYKKRMIKDFGKVLDIYFVNKGISSDGCFLGNSTCVAQSSNWKSRKIWMYMTQMRYKIQMYSILRNKELWFWLPNSCNGDFKYVVNKLSKYKFDTLFDLGTTQQRELGTTSVNN